MRIRQSYTLLSLLTLGFMGVGTQVAAADLFVSPSGSGSSSCTSGTPCTITRANTLATAGTTIQLASGTYTGNITVSTAGTSVSRIVWKSTTKWGADFTGSVTVSGNYVDWQDTEIYTPSGSSSPVLLLTLDGNYSRAVGNYVHHHRGTCGGSGGAGIEAQGWLSGGYNGHDQEILGNIVEDVGVGARDGTCGLVHGIYAAVPYVKIKNNVVLRSIGDGITSWHAASNLTIVNNTAADNGVYGIDLGNGDSGASQMTGSVVNNNVSVDNTYNAIGQCCGGSSFGTNTFTNNTGWSNGSTTVVAACPSVGCVSTISGSTNLLSSPFVSYSTDLHPASGSSLIDSGTSTEAPSSDIEGNSRPQGSAVDRGAYEVLNTIPNTNLSTATVNSGATTIATNGSTSTTATDASFSGFSVDAGQTATSYECKLDAGAYATCTSPKNYTSLTVGSHTFSLRACNGAGCDATPVTRTWTVTSPGTEHTFVVESDVHVRSDLATTNFEGATDLELDGDPTRRILLAFSGIPTSGITITAAKLRVYFTWSVSQSYEVHASSCSYNPSTVTYNTAPSVGSLWATDSTDPTGWNDVPLSPSNGVPDGFGYVCMTVTRSGDLWGNIESLENAGTHPAELVLTY